VRGGDCGGLGPPGGVGELRVPWATCGSAVLGRIRLAQVCGQTGAAQVFAQPGRLSNPGSLRAPSSGRTNGRRTDTGARRGDAFDLLRPHAAKGRTHEDPPPAGRPAPPGPGARARPAMGEVRGLLLIAVAARTRRLWAAIGPETLRKRGSAKRPGRPRNHPPHPAPAPDRATANRPPKPGGPRAPGGAPLVRRELGPLARAGVSSLPASMVSRVMGDIRTWRPSTTVLRPVCNARNPQVRFGPACSAACKRVGHVPSVFPTLRDQPPRDEAALRAAGLARRYPPKDFDGSLRPGRSMPNTEPTGHAPVLVWGSPRDHGTAR
jgi:hypothetical protein